MYMRVYASVFSSQEQRVYKIKPRFVQRIKKYNNKKVFKQRNYWLLAKKKRRDRTTDTKYRLLAAGKVDNSNLFSVELYDEVSVQHSLALYYFYSILICLENTNREDDRIE